MEYPKTTNLAVSRDQYHPAIRPRRIGLCGGTVILPENADFAEMLGIELASEEGVILVSGGFKCFDQNTSSQSADWSFVNGASNWLQSQKLVVDKHIETLLPAPKYENIGAIRFKEGRIISLEGRSLQARRFKLVGATDTLVAIEGKKGTREIIDLALALDKPILPLPFTNGIAKSRWFENKILICEWFEINKRTAKEWESLSLINMNKDQIIALARSVKQHLLHQLRRKCFVMMPFSQEYMLLYNKVIKPVIEASGFLAVRTDQLGLIGNVVDALHGAIRTSACGLAVITGNNPNVMYELGLTHALNKHVIILCEFNKNKNSLPELPFDLRNESVIGYSLDNLDMIKQLLHQVFIQMKNE